MNLRVAIAKIANHLRTFPTAVLILLAGSAFAATEAPNLQQLRDHLKKAQEAEDKPAIIELSQRVVAAAPNTVRYEAVNAMLLNEFLKNIARSRD